MKNNAWAVWRPPEAWGPGPAGPLVRRPCWCHASTTPC